MIGIYKIENKLNHKVYIGQSIHLERRQKDHIKALCRGKHINKHLQSAWNKYGQDNFEFSVLEECAENILTEREQYWIDYYGGLNSSNNYNKREAGDKGHLSEESRLKCSLHNKGKKVIITETTKQKISQALKGRPAKNKGISPSEETKKKLSIRNKGKKKPAFTEEHKRKLSESHKGKPAWNKGISNKHKGEQLTEQQKLKLRQLHSQLRGIPIRQLDLSGNIIAQYPSTMEAERKTGIKNSNIGACIRGLQKTAGGYIWQKV